MGDDANIITLGVACPKGLGRLLSAIAAERGIQITAVELSEAVRLAEECRRADAGVGVVPGRPEGLLPRAIPVGCLVVRTPTIRARLALQTAARWVFPAGLSEEGRAEFSALLTAWILHHGRGVDELALLSEETAPVIVADLRARMGATLGELQAAIGEVARDLYPEASLLDYWADLDDERATLDWAGVLLTLAAEGCGTAEQLIDAPEPQVHHLLASLRRRRQAESGALDSQSTAAPDPQSPKCRAARAWTAFEAALRSCSTADGGNEEATT
jgi:hypothetical protein